MTWIIIVIAVGCLAYANGANDNFKGVATLFGSGTTNYRGALAWATVTTFLGSLSAVFLAGVLLANFSGKGLVDDALVSTLDYRAAVALGAGLTVLLATRIGMPISTTHSLVGALVGAGWAAHSAIDFGKLNGSFFLPLLVSPVLALVATGLAYPILHYSRRRFGISEQTCFCVGSETLAAVPVMDRAGALLRTTRMTVEIGDPVTCYSRYQGRLLGIEASVVLDRLHFASSGLVSFARGLNDTPKIAALLLLVPHVGQFSSTAIVGLAIVVGGLVSARKVAETMSQKITPMNHGQGFTANLFTAVIVISASWVGWPVSTTHVSCGSLFGIAAANRQGHLATIAKILAAWLMTLPLGILLGAVCYSALTLR